MRTVREFERAGANAIQLEDQDFPKRCGHLDGKALIPAQEMCGKIRAAVDARRSRETLIIARTDAVAVEGFDRAIERAAMYREAGADMLFVEAPQNARRSRPHRHDARRQGAADGQHGRGRQDASSCPRPSSKPSASPGDLPGRHRARARPAWRASTTARSRQHGTNEPFRNRMLDFEGINALIGTPEMIALGKRYETDAPPADKKSGARR